MSKIITFIVKLLFKMTSISSNTNVPVVPVINEEESITKIDAPINPSGLSISPVFLRIGEVLGVYSIDTLIQLVLLIIINNTKSAFHSKAILNNPQNLLEHYEEKFTVEEKLDIRAFQKVSRTIESAIKSALKLVKKINLFSSEYHDTWENTEPISTKETVLLDKRMISLSAHYFSKKDVLFVRINKKDYEIGKNIANTDMDRHLLPQFEFNLILDIKNKFSDNANMNSFLHCLMDSLKEDCYFYDLHIPSPKNEFLKGLILNGKDVIISKVIHPLFLGNLLSYRNFFQMFNNAVALICNTVYDNYHHIFGVHRERLTPEEIVYVLFEVVSNHDLKTKKKLKLFSNITTPVTDKMHESFEITLCGHPSYKSI